MASDASRGNLGAQQTPKSTLPKTVPATFLKTITNDFSVGRELGRSVFGTLYMGILPDGKVVAVKKLAENFPVAQGKTFDTEVTNLMALQHTNIVELVGFCNESKKDLVLHNGRYVLVDIMDSFLLYNHLSNGSLDKFLCAESSRQDWGRRFQIIKGICQGLQFLHMKPDGALVHMNIVPSSIWLDDNWVPKIADFGLSRLFGQDKTRITMNVMGQNGYMAPEYLYRGEISTKSDIYSLGMVIIEITTGENNCGNADDKSARTFVDKVHQNWKTYDQLTSEYPSLDPKGLQQVKACIEIGLQCVEVDRNKRPSIVDIVRKLNGQRIG